jgi:hypothetical protein
VTYPTKVDWWLLVLAAISVALGPVLILILSPSLNEALGMMKQVLPWTALTVAVIILLAWPVYYRLDAEELYIRSGLLLRWHLPYDHIVQVHATRNALSSPAWSLDRLQIDRLGGSPILISPADQEGFLAELATRAILTRDGSRLVRQSTFGR